MSDDLRPTLTDVNEMARTLMDAWEKAEGKPVSVSYIATFTDLARAALTPAPGTAGRWHFVAADDVLLPRPAYDALLAATPTPEVADDERHAVADVLHAERCRDGLDACPACFSQACALDEAGYRYAPVAEVRPDGDALAAVRAWRASLHQPMPADASEWTRNHPGFAEDVLDRLEHRYRSEPVPPCRVCGAPLTVAAMGGGPTKYACSVTSVGDADWGEHYGRSTWTEPNSGDSDVVTLVVALRAALAAADATPESGDLA